MLTPQSVDLYVNLHADLHKVSKEENYTFLYEIELQNLYVSAYCIFEKETDQSVILLEHVIDREHVIQFNNNDIIDGAKAI